MSLVSGPQKNSSRVRQYPCNESVSTEGMRVRPSRLASLSPHNRLVSRPKDSGVVIESGFIRIGGTVMNKAGSMVSSSGIQSCWQSFWGCLWGRAALANSSCLMPLGDVTGDGATDVSDVQCSILMSLAGWSPKLRIRFLPECGFPLCRCGLFQPDHRQRRIDDRECPWRTPNPQLDTDVRCPDSCEQGPFCMDCEADDL